MSEAKEIEGQLSSEERQILTAAILEAPDKPKVVLEVGTWLGGGSTLHLLRALEKNGIGHLWGIEADRSIYERMLANIRAAAPEASARFTPLFGFSDEVIPAWLNELGPQAKVDVAFLDGGNNPGEQVTEFHLLDPRIPVGGQLLSHDANMRKGKWFVPYLLLLDHWQVKVHRAQNGLLYARKIAAEPSNKSRRAARLKLWRMRLNPIEIAAAILPATVCAFALRLLPRRFSQKLSDG